MYNFQYANPTRICFGEGQIATLPELVPAGSRLLVLYGGGSIKQTGLYDRITTSLEAAGVEWVELAGVKPNPRLSLVRTHSVGAGGSTASTGTSTRAPTIANSAMAEPRS